MQLDLDGKFRLPKAKICDLYWKDDKETGYIGDYKAVVGERGQFYAIVTRYYRLVLHEDLCNMVNKLLDEYRLNKVKEFITIDRDGAVMFYDVMIEEEKIRDDNVYFGFRVTNSYDTSVGIYVDAFAFRLQCRNQFIASNKIIGGYKKHLRYSIGEKLDKLKELVEKVIKGIRDFKDILRMATKSTVTAEEVAMFIVEEFNLSEKELIEVAKRVDKYTKSNVSLVVRKILIEKKEEEMRKKIEKSDRYVIIGDSVTEKRIVEIAEKEIDKELNLYDVYNGFTEAFTWGLQKLDEVTKYRLNKKASEILVAAVG